MIQRLILALLIAGTAYQAGHGAPAYAQNRDMNQLINRIDRLQRELTTLQRYIYQNPRQSGSGAKGARPPLPAPATISPSVAARLEVRLTQLETEIRTMTGQSEELSHAVRQLNARLGKLVSDVDMRLSALEQAQARLQAPATAQAGGDTAPPATTAGRPPGTLGVIPKGAAGKKDGEVASRTGLPKGTPKQQYDYAISLMLKQQNFAAAERALRAFIEANPDHALASNAHYWLGETYYVRKDYQQAAFAFADGFQKFPRASKAPDSLLKLGMSLGQLGRHKEACTAYARLLDNFPKTRKDLKARVSRQQRQLKCE